MFHCTRSDYLDGALRPAGHDRHACSSVGSLGSGHRLAGDLAPETARDADAIDGLMLSLSTPQSRVSVFYDCKRKNGKGGWRNEGGMLTRDLQGCGWRGRYFHHEIDIG